MKIYIISCFILLSVYSKAQIYSLFDPSFGLDGVNEISTADGDDFGHSIIFQPDNKIVIAGNAGTFNIARMHADGSIDNTFNGGIVKTTRSASDYNTLVSSALQADGKIVLLGYDADGDLNITRLNANGTTDTSFNGGWVSLNAYDEQEYYTYDVEIQTDGKIVFCGLDYSYSFFGDGADLLVCRLNVNGTFDNTFSGDGKLYGGSLPDGYNIGRTVFLQDDGKLLIGGYYGKENDESFPQIARYNTDGTLDLSFSGTGYFRTKIDGDHGRIYDMMQNDAGKTICVGYKGEYDGHNDIFMMQLDATGELDLGFADGGYFIYETELSSQLRSMTLDQDENILVTGFTNDGLGDADFFTARFTPEGILDSTFGLNGIVTSSLSTKDDIAFDITIQTDNKILVGGTMAENGNANFVVVRYLDDALLAGIIDEPFANEKFLVFPNPVAANEVSLGYELLENETVTIQLFNSKGQLLQTFVDNVQRLNGENSETLQFNTDLPQGNYFIKILTAHASTSIQIIKI